ncbi:ABC transporter permease [Halogeometricum luteum]|uniref:ABC transporter permease n=1 Tax=Halogeometricum luteum TaxID=2950537 RepID=A0ABU2FYY0_9EURY|nr:ABC transporter permease [Halogeometricum sp. S3BR5-2]MDS0293742.1 ABC transporter permease [Halogeometricum sp. S3BR5-2]
MSRRQRMLARVPTLVLARRNLSRATARSVLAVLAVVIGVVAIGTIGVGGEAFKQDQSAAYEGFGGTATVTPVYYPDSEGPVDQSLSAQEIDRMRQATAGATVLPVVQRWDALVRTESGDTVPTAQLKGLGTPGAFYDVRAGTIPENWRRSAVVGSRVADTNDIEPGDQVTVAVNGSFDRSFRVAAVLEAQGFADPLQADRSIFLPLGQFDQSAYDSAIVSVDARTASIDRAAASIESEFNTRRRTVNVQKAREQREQFEQLFETINQFLIGVGGISLVVAAVTIANTMLMSAIERETEIGVMRAVGYPKRAVVSLLVAEAGILGVIGAAIGVPLAFAIGAGLNQFLLGDPWAFTATGVRYIALGAVFGVVTSVLAGLYPGWKAASKRPLEALE